MVTGARSEMLSSIANLLGLQGVLRVPQVLTIGDAWRPGRALAPSPGRERVSAVKNPVSSPSHLI